MPASPELFGILRNTLEPSIKLRPAKKFRNNFSQKSFDNISKARKFVGRFCSLQKQDFCGEIFQAGKRKINFRTNENWHTSCYSQCENLQSPLCKYIFQFYQIKELYL